MQVLHQNKLNVKTSHFYSSICDQSLTETMILNSFSKFFNNLKYFLLYLVSISLEKEVLSDHRSKQVFGKFESSLGTNLNKLVSVFGINKCFIHITNHAGINILPIEYPVFIRSICAVISIFPKINDGLPYNLCSEWILCESFSNRQNIPKNCSCNELSENFKYKKYTPLNLTSLVSSSKPWNCEMRINLNPPSGIIKELERTSKYQKSNEMVSAEYPVVHQYEGFHSKKNIEYEDRKYVLTNLLPIVYINIFNEDLYANISRDSLEKFWASLIVRTIIRNNDYMPSNIVTFSKIITKKETLNGSLLDDNWSIWTQCLMCRSYFDSQHKRVSKLHWQSLTYRKISSYVDNMIINQPQMWVIVFNTVIAGMSQAKLASTFETCDNKKIFFRNFNSHKTPSRNNYYQSLFSVWKSLMYNYTYLVLRSHVADQGLTCSNDKLLSYKRRNDFPMAIISYILTFESTKFDAYGSLKLRDSQNQLRIISCGKIKTEHIRFNELYSVFDCYVWMFNAITLLVFLAFWEVNLPTKCFSTAVRRFVEILNTFVEKPSKVVDDLRTKYPFTLAIFSLCVGIIISNAYKNTNVYNMVKPMKTIPYEHISQLVNDKFKIFSKAAKVYPHIHINIETEAKNLNRYVAEKYGFYLVLHSEVDLLDRFKTTASVLKTTTTLFPEDISLFKNLLDRFGNTLKLIETLIENQEVQIRKTLKKCENVAFVLPEKECDALAKTLTKEDSLFGKIYVTQQKFSMSSFGFNFIGNLPPYLLRRIQFPMHESGIWQWLSTITRRNHYDFRTMGTVEAPSMNGNVLVIFIVYICGLCISTFCLAIERQLLKFLFVFVRLMCLTIFDSMRSMSNLIFKIFVISSKYIWLRGTICLKKRNFSVIL